MKVNLAHFFFAILSFTIFIANAQANTPSISVIEKLAKETVSKKIQAPISAQVVVSPQPLDPRITLPNCISPLTVELAADRDISRNNTVKVSCDIANQNYPWQVYMSVRVDISFAVVVPTETIAQGTVLSRANLTMKYIDQYSLNGQQFDDVTPLIGSKLKRRVTKDYPIYDSNVCFVCKGDQVSIVAATDSFRIKTVGEALEDGNLGQQISVKNTRSNRVIDAIVAKVGEVHIKM